MSETHLKALSIFYPEEFNIVEQIGQKKFRFVQYTSANAAMSIIQNKEVWLRNVQCMNDYREVEHGINCLVSTFKNEEGKKFQSVMEELFPGVIDRFTKLFDSWLPALRTSTYLTCVSEHENYEDIYGRLSMWRAYGGKQPVAIVMNTTAFGSESDALSAYTYPVLYQDLEQFNLEFERLTSRITIEKEFVKSMGEQDVTNYLFDVFKSYALCVKHPGFKEEREWRVVYNPLLRPSDRITSSIEVIDGVPQKVHKIPLVNIPEENLIGMNIPELIDRIIIGPSDHQYIIASTFIGLLEEAGCENAAKKVSYSGIPLRTE